MYLDTGIVGMAATRPWLLLLWSVQGVGFSAGGKTQRLAQCERVRLGRFVW